MTSPVSIVSPLWLFTGSQISQIYDIVRNDKDTVKQGVLPAMFLEISRREIEQKDNEGKSIYLKGKPVKIEATSWSEGEDILSHPNEPNHATDFIFNSAFLTGYKIPPNRSASEDNRRRYYPPSAQLIHHIDDESRAGTIEIIKHPNKTKLEKNKHVLPGDILLWGPADGQTHGFQMMVISTVDDRHVLTREAGTHILAGNGGPDTLGDREVFPSNRQSAVYRFKKIDWPKVALFYDLSQQGRTQYERFKVRGYYSELFDKFYAWVRPPASPQVVTNVPNNPLTQTDKNILQRLEDLSDFAESSEYRNGMLFADKVRVFKQDFTQRLTMMRQKAEMFDGFLLTYAALEKWSDPEVTSTYAHAFPAKYPGTKWGNLKDKHKCNLYLYDTLHLTQIGALIDGWMYFDRPIGAGEYATKELVIPGLPVIANGLRKSDGTLDFIGEAPDMGDVVTFGTRHVGIYLGHDLYISATSASHPRKDHYFGQQHLVIKELADSELLFRRPIRPE